MLPPFLLERWYGLIWWLMLAVTAVVVIPLCRIYLRLRERHLGLPLTSFSSFLVRFLDW